MMYWKKQQLRRMIAIGLVGGSFIAAHPVHASEALVGDGNVIIEAGESYDKVIGGSIDQGLDDVKVSVKGDVKNNLSGGSTAQTQDVAVKNVTIAISDNAQVEHIQGGGIAINDHNSIASNTNIQVSGNAVIKTINGGGGSEGGNTHVDHAVIRIDGGIIGDQYSFDAKEGNGISGGGYTYQGGKSSVDQAEIHINGGQILGNVTGGGIAGENGEVSVKDSTITISGTKLDSVVVIGGGISDGTNSKTTGNKATISISNSYVSPDNHITGGNWVKNGGFGNLDMAVIQIEKSDVGRVSGAGFVENANAKVGEVVMNIKDSFVNNELRLGGSAIHGTLDIGKVSLVAENSQLNGNLFGGGYTSKYGDDGTEYESGGKVTIDQSNITVKGGQIAGNIYGGGWVGERGNEQINKSELRFNNTKFSGSVLCGGGIIDGTGSVGIINQTSIHIINGETSSAEHHITGGAWVTNGGTGTMGTALVNITDSKVGRVSGAGFVENANAKIGEVNIQVKNSTVNNELRLGGAAVGGQLDIGTANLTFENSTLNGTLFGGGYASKLGDNGIAYEKGGKVVIDQSNIRLNNSQLNGNVYAGGWAQDDSKVLVKTSDIIIDNSVINGSVYAGGYNTGTGEANVENAVIHISAGEIKGDILRGNAEKAELNFMAGTGSTIGGTVSGFEAVTVEKGAKTDWTGGNLTHQFSSLTVAEGGTINIGKAMIFDFGSVSQVAAYSRVARAVQNGIFNINGAVNLAQGSTLTMQNGTVTTSGKGGFFSEVDKSNLSNSGKVAWGSNAEVKGELHIGFSNLTNTEIGELGKTSDFKDLVDSVADTSKLRNGQRITNPKGSITDFEVEKTTTGTNVVVAPRTSASGVATYTGIRQGSAYISHNIVENIHEHTAGLRSGDKANEFWAGIRGGSTEIETSFGGAEVNAQYYQLGYDWDLSSDNQKATIGLYFTKIAGDSTNNGFKNDVGSAYDFGIYGTKELDSGNYISLIGRYGQIGNSLHTDVQTTEWKDKGYGLSMEFGNRNIQANGLMLEPYIQFNYNHFSASDFNVGADKVGWDSGSMLDGKLGLRLIKQIDDNPNNTIFGSIAYSKGLSGNYMLKDRRNGKELGGVDNDANTVELSIGINRQISKCSNINFDVKKEFGDYKGWGLQGALNVSF